MLHKHPAAAPLTSKFIHAFLTTRAGALWSCFALVAALQGCGVAPYESDDAAPDEPGLDDRRADMDGTGANEGDGGAEAPDTGAPDVGMPVDEFWPPRDVDDADLGGDSDLGSAGAADAGAADAGTATDAGTTENENADAEADTTTDADADAGAAADAGFGGSGGDVGSGDFGPGDGGTAAPLPVVDPFPARLVSSADLHSSGFGTIEFEARDGNILTAHVYRATQFAPWDGPVLFVMHGVGRTADSYLRAAAPLAERRGALAVAIEFDELRYPTSESYTLAVGTDGRPSGPTYDPTDWRPVSDYGYSEVEHLFEAVRTELSGQQPGYLLFGHSAGAQFTHRLLTFIPSNRVLRAVAANSGWYTLPRSTMPSAPDAYIPYGLRGTPVESDAARIVGAPLTILVGTRDTLAGSSLRSTSEAMTQGSNRLERGQFYYSAGQQQATSLAAPFAWRLGYAPLAGHDKDEMLPSADFFLFESAPTPCTPNVGADASGLVFNEIHADPAVNGGDANADGIRDSADDEFVELVNNSASPLCLSGWTLGDLSDSERHVFPVGSLVEPGGSIVVFGGGIPTGDFGGARVEWAAFGGQLSLTNAGDVLTLRDASGTAVKQVSWGDCGSQVCAADHIPSSLSIDASMTRVPDATGGWVEHDATAPPRFSPGTRTTGSPF